VMSSRRRRENITVMVDNMKPLRGFGPGRVHFSIDMFSLTGKAFI
jgi:hypothetical protein